MRFDSVHEQKGVGTGLAFLLLLVVACLGYVLGCAAAFGS
jgi:hypothetical protein